MTYLQRIAFWYLTMFLLFSVGRDFQAALTFSRSTDYAVFQAAGIDGAFVSCLTASLVLDMAASYYVLRPKALGFWVILVALGFAAIYNIGVFGLASGDPETTKAAYLASRELRGLPANPETAEKVFSPDGMKATLGIALFLGLSSLGALAINRWRFFPETKTEQSTGDA